MTDEQRHDWHLDRKVTIGLIATLFLNIAATSWWAATMQSAVSTLQVVDNRHEVLLQALAIGREANANRLTALEESKNDIKRRLDVIDENLLKVLERLPPRRPIN